MQEMQKLRNVISQYAEIPAKEWSFFQNFVYSKNFDKNELLLRAGEEASEFFYIVDGLVRLYYSTSEGKVFNRNFITTNQFCGSISSTVQDIPCPYSISALETTQTLAIKAADFQKLYDRHRCWDRFMRIFAQQVIVVKEKRTSELLTFCAASRYQQFLQDFAEIKDRIPQYHIASYLGITNVALSRIRKRLSQGNT